MKSGGVLNVVAATKVNERTAKDGFKWVDPEYKTFPYPKSHIKRYHNCLLQLAGINGLARDLMDWLTIKMDNNNQVHHTEPDSEIFISHLREAAKENKFNYKIPSIRSVDRAWALLIKRGMLYKKKRSVYIVNPEYFISSRNEKSRPILIQMILEFRYDTYTKMKVKREME